jgi:hypothetical protein
MTTKARAWPNNAREARDQAAEQAARGLRIIRPLLTETEVTETEKIRRIAIATDAFLTILRMLESVGAQTKP